MAADRKAAKVLKPAVPGVTVACRALAPDREAIAAAMLAPEF